MAGGTAFVRALANVAGFCSVKIPAGEAKTTLSESLVLAERGDDVAISRSGVPVARLVPVISTSGSARRGGFLTGQIRIGEDPLPAEVQQAFGGGAPDGSPSRG